MIPKCAFSLTYWFVTFNQHIGKENTNQNGIREAEYWIKWTGGGKNPLSSSLSSPTWQKTPHSRQLCSITCILVVVFCTAHPVRRISNLLYGRTSKRGIIHSSNSTSKCCIVDSCKIHPHLNVASVTHPWKIWPVLLPTVDQSFKNRHIHKHFKTDVILK